LTTKLEKLDTDQRKGVRGGKKRGGDQYGSGAGID